MTSIPEPTPDASPLTTPPGVPEGAFLALPQPTQPGEVIPPIPCQFQFGLTTPDVKGHQWVVLSIGDGTVTGQYRIPWQLAEQVGAQVAQGLSAMARRAASEANGGLVVPGGTRGGLFVPGGPGRGVPPLNGGGRD
jgi:hypothetical protein